VVSAIRIGEHRVEVEAVVFDLFHTLVDPQEHVAPGFRRLAAVADILGIAASEVELWWEQVVGELVTSPVSPIQSLVEFARSRRIVLSPGDVAELDRAMGAGADAALARPIAGAVETLAGLRRRGLGVALLSNALVRDVQTYLESPLAGVVDDACLSCFIGLAKPDPAAYSQVLERIGAVAARCLYVGDGGSDEFVGARSSRFGGVIGVTGAVERGGWRSSAEQQRIIGQADTRLESVSQLLGMLEGG
jgi:putative hydrolase of the HAD superfamily